MKFLTPWDILHNVFTAHRATAFPNTIQNIPPVLGLKASNKKMIPFFGRNDKDTVEVVSLFV